MKRKKKQVAKVFAKTDDGTLTTMYFDKDDDDFKLAAFSEYALVTRGECREVIFISPREKLVYIVRSCR